MFGIQGSYRSPRIDNTYRGGFSCRRSRTLNIHTSVYEAREKHLFLWLLIETSREGHLWPNSTVWNAILASAVTDGCGTSTPCTSYLRFLLFVVHLEHLLFDCSTHSTLMSYSGFAKSYKWILLLLPCHIRQLNLRKLAKVRASEKHSQDLSSSHLHPEPALSMKWANWTGFRKTTPCHTCLWEHTVVSEQSGITKNDLTLSNRGKQIMEDVRQGNVRESS